MKKKQIKKMSEEDYAQMQKLKEELHDLRLSDTENEVLVKKSQELDKYINQMMSLMNRNLDKEN